MSGSNSADGGGSGQSGPTINSAPTVLVNVYCVCGTANLAPPRVAALSVDRTLEAIFGDVKPPNNAVNLFSVSASFDAPSAEQRWLLLDGRNGLNPASTSLEKLSEVGGVKALKFDCVKVAGRASASVYTVSPQPLVTDGLTPLSTGAPRASAKAWCTLLCIHAEASLTPPTSSHRKCV